MRLCQFFVPGRGKRVGVVEDHEVLDITSADAAVRSVHDLIAESGTLRRLERRLAPLVTAARVRFAWLTLDRPPSPRHAHLLAPLDPPEIWGAGITYQRPGDHDETHTGDEGRSIYDYVYSAERPDLFFKATAARTAGPNAPIGIRHDSTLTAVEPELAVVIGVDGEIVGYSAANDVSAWDIERENPLFLPQSKMFQGCFALGPVITTASECPDPHGLELACRITRDGTTLYEGRASTKDMRRRCPELVDWLRRSNPIPPGTVLSTGAGILVPDDYALADGDIVDVTIAGIGRLRNPVKKLD
jgi:2-dehydro-3-deoxy-D-arabinonate dehydratase